MDKIDYKTLIKLVEKYDEEASRVLAKKNGGANMLTEKDYCDETILG